MKHWIPPQIIFFLSVLISVGAVWGLTGCTTPEQIDPESAVITAGAITITRADFTQELEMKLISYSYTIKDRPDEYNSMVLDLVSDLSDEAVLLAAADAKGIEVSSEELDAAVAEFKKDYPEDSFDKMLLDRAILFTVWKKSLKKDMVIQKLIRRELVAAQEINPRDMIAFHGRLADEAGDKDNAASNAMNEQDLVKQLRLEKSQDAFEKWMQGLKSQYPVQINQPGVRAFLVN